MRTLLYGILLVLLTLQSVAAEEIYLRDNLMKATPGDYLVTAQGSQYTLLLIRDKKEGTLTIEEVTVPGERFSKELGSWRQWVQNGAPGHTAWVVYEIVPASGEMRSFFSFTKNGWCDIADSDNFLGTLLNLRLARRDPSSRRRVGPMPRDGYKDQRPFWNPRVVVEGQTIKDVPFNAWKTRWPKDGSELSGKTIEVYLPRDGDKYPSYFPYWLQIGGVVGKAKVRIIDSGFNLRSPRNIPVHTRVRDHAIVG